MKKNKSHNNLTWKDRLIIASILLIIFGGMFYIYLRGTIKFYVPRGVELGYRAVTIHYRDKPDNIIRAVIDHDPGLAGVPYYLIWQYIVAHSDVNEYATEWKGGTVLYVPYTTLAGEGGDIYRGH